MILKKLIIVKHILIINVFCVNLKHIIKDSLSIINVILNVRIISHNVFSVTNIQVKIKIYQIYNAYNVKNIILYHFMVAFHAHKVVHLVIKEILF